MDREYLRAEAKGHGVPEVMDAIYYKRGVIRPVVAVVKSVASALAIGSGAAVGAGRADYPDRFGPRLDARSIVQNDRRTTHHACGGRAQVQALRPP